MSLFEILETLLIGPLKLVFEIIYFAANSLIGHPGLAIIFLSLVMNILVLPLYKRADAMQEAARDVDAKLHDGVAHIKKTFSGDERMMILQTYYRQNHYKPTSALNGSVSLLLEIPFFMAAYQFLSHLEILEGVSLGPIRDLAAPDGLLVIGGIAINVLPIVMTLVNVLSSALYLKGFPLKTKFQLYAMALFFLVFLYTSPSCLVFYWTLNNVFSLGKNIVYKLKRPAANLRTKLKSKPRRRRSRPVPQPNLKLFLLGAAFLTVLIGLLIPSTFIAASPQEYVDITHFHHPLWYIVSTFCLAAGTFLVWMGVFYWLASPRGKAFFVKLMWILCGITLVNYMFFGTDLGVISATLQYEYGLYFSIGEQWINIAVLVDVILILYIIIFKWKRAVATVLVVAIVALSTMSAVNLVTIRQSVDKISTSQANFEDGSPYFTLSKTGKNVVVLMLDRGMSAYVPYMFAEKPELKEQFAGFTYYRNTISFGGYTNIAIPSLLGGYEYTPVEMNKRADEALVDKHNEALKVMPTLFADNGFDVTVCDPVYANYQWIPDLSIFDDRPDIDAYITKGKFSDPGQKVAVIENNHRNFFCFSLMKSMPLFLQFSMYDNGRYNQATKFVPSTQTTDGISVGTGLFSSFMESYNAMASMSSMTKITEDGTNTFLFMSNDMTHEPMLLQEPDYTPAQDVDNTEYDATHADRFYVDGQQLEVDTAWEMSHYQANMAALLLLGDWFDYLRSNDVYDNTKIILVSDHGRNLAQVDDLIMGNGSSKDVQLYYPMLMVKDFDSKEFTTSDEFMTNADVPTLATKDLLDDPRNPFTGKPLNNDEKTAHEQFVFLSSEWDVDDNNGNTYIPGYWASVKDDLWEKDNWTFYSGKTVLDEHKKP